MDRDRARFMGHAARTMRGLIVDHVRNGHAQKRGGCVEITALDTDVADNVADHVQLSRVGNALDELAQVEAEPVQIVDLKFFCGFSFAEITALRGVSERAVQRNWEKARIYLHRTLSDDPPLA